MLVVLHAPVLGLLEGVAFWEHDIPSEHCLARFTFCVLYIHTVAAFGGGSWHRRMGVQKVASTRRVLSFPQTHCTAINPDLDRFNRFV